MQESKVLCFTFGQRKHILSHAIKLAKFQTLLLFYTVLLHWCEHRDLCSPLQCRIFHPSGKLIDHKSSPWLRLHWPEDLDESLTMCAAMRSAGNVCADMIFQAMIHSSVILTVTAVCLVIVVTTSPQTPKLPTCLTLTFFKISSVDFSSSFILKIALTWTQTSNPILLFTTYRTRIMLLDIHWWLKN